MSAWWLGGSMMGGGAVHGGAVISSILKYLKYIHANKSIWCLDCEYYGRNRELFELFSYSESVTVINSDTAADQLDDYLIIRELRRLGCWRGARPGVDISTQMSPLAVAFLILSCLLPPMQIICQPFSVLCYNRLCSTG